MTRPVRLQLSRRKGFDLQALSLATNGLPAVNVARPSKWGNPFSIHPDHRPGRSWGPPGCETFSVPTAEDAVACFVEMMNSPGDPGTRAFELRGALSELRGRNLACWCAPGSPCHGNVLLEMANGPMCEAVG